MNRFAALYHRVRNALIDGSMASVVQVRARSESQGGFRSHVKVRDFDIVVDQPRGFEGENKGPKPSELVLAALAACQEVTWRLYGEAHGVPITDVRVELTGTQDLRGFLGADDTVAPGFQAITGTVTVVSPASAEEIERLRDIVDRHCPVLDDLRRPLDVSLDLAVEQVAVAKA